MHRRTSSIPIFRLDVDYLLYIGGADRQNKRLSLTYPRKRLFITQQWLDSKNLPPRKQVY
jgi:hypothetical protein